MSDTTTSVLASSAGSSKIMQTSDGLTDRAFATFHSILHCMIFLISFFWSTQCVFQEKAFEW